MIERLSVIFKKYVTIFLEEYAEYLSKEQLEILRNFNYEKAICLDSVDKPFGEISLGRVCLAKDSDELINKLKNMPNYNTVKSNLHNKNMSSYLKYMCDNGYSVEDYYCDILMYFVFKLVIKNNSGIIWGLINQEMKYLSIKYSLRLAFIYAREDAVVGKITPILGINTCRKLIFMDNSTAFKYLNEKYGFRYANLFNDVSILIDKSYIPLKNKEYDGFEGFLNYTEEYDKISYGDAYNCILDFKAENNLLI